MSINKDVSKILKLCMIGYTFLYKNCQFYFIIVTHLSSQDYDICIRRPAGTTVICYTQCTNTAGIAAANSAATAQVRTSINHFAKVSVEFSIRFFWIIAKRQNIIIFVFNCISGKLRAQVC